MHIGLDLLEENEQLDKRTFELRKKLSELNLAKERRDHFDPNEYIEKSSFRESDPESEEENLPARDNLAEELNRLNVNEVRTLGEKVASLEQELSGANAKVNALTLENESLANQRDNLFEKLALKDRIIDEFDKKGKSVNEESKKYIAQIKQLTDKLEKLQQKNLELLKASQQGQSAKVAQEQSLTGLKKEVAKLNADIATKNKKVQSLTEEIAKIKTQSEEKLAKGVRERKDPDNEADAKKLKETQQLAKTQAELIDVLKRQKAQLQASVLLKMSQDQFVKILESEHKLVK